MAKVVWTDQAILDLDDIGEYTAKDSLNMHNQLHPDSSRCLQLFESVDG